MADAFSIVHVMRSPVGGLFRHVVDLAREQTARGHRVGIVADASTGGERADSLLAEFDRDLAFGVLRLPMSRELGPSDWSAGRKVRQHLADKAIDIVHGHGSKGGAYARLVGGGRLKVYTPHGGSLHYSRATPVGFVYLTLESVLAARTDLFLFESQYGRDTFRAKVCEPKGTVRVVHNGVGAAEFEPVPPASHATDLLFIGEMRHLKGVDVLLDALALLRERGRALSATLVGAGPDVQVFRDQAQTLGLSDSVSFPGAMPAREAFALGRLLIAPSRAESLPYILLEAGAAGLPLISTAIGGIPEIFGPDSDRLVPAGDAPKLAEATARALDQPHEAATAAARLRERIQAQFSIHAMTDGVLDAYRDAMAARTDR